MLLLFIQATEFRQSWFLWILTGIISSYYQFSFTNMTSLLSKFLQFGLIVPALATDQPYLVMTDK